MIRIGLPLGRMLALDSAQTPHLFQIHLRPDGGLKVRPLKQGRRSGQTVSFLALDPALLYRRRLGGRPRGRPELTAMATDLFPFDPASTLYAASRDGMAETGFYCWACPEEQLEALRGELRSLKAVLIASPRAECLEAALTERLHSTLADLQPRPATLLPPASLVAAGLLALGLGLAVWGWSRWDGLRAARLAALESRVAALETKTTPLIEKRRALIRMQASYDALANLAETPGATLPGALARTWQAVPQGSHIDELIFTDQTLTVSGLGNDAEDWISGLGIPAQKIDIADRPSTDRFHFRWDLKTPTTAENQPEEEAQR